MRCCHSDKIAADIGYDSFCPCSMFTPIHTCIKFYVDGIICLGQRVMSKVFYVRVCMYNQGI